MWNPDRQPPPEWIQDAYELIVAHVDDPDEGFPRERTLDVLLGHEAFEDEPGDAKYAIERLLARGWFYEVQGTIGVISPKRDPD